MDKELQPTYKANAYIQHDLQFAIRLTEHTPRHFNNDLYKREFWKIAYFISGQGTLLINNKRYPVGPGFICLIHPDDLTTMEISGNLTLYNIMFMRELIAEDLEKLYNAYNFFTIFNPDFDPAKSLSHDQLHLLDSNRIILSLIKRMAHEYQHQDANSKELLRFQLLELLINLSRLSTRSFSKRRRSEMVDYITSYLERHYQEPLSIQRVADEFGISKGYLYSIYQKNTGRTIGQTLLEIRLREVMRLLMESDMTVENICYSSGFTDLCNFYKVFKREVGCAPGQYRKRFTLLS